MKTILTAALAVFFAIPASAQFYAPPAVYQPRVTYQQWLKISAAHREWMSEYHFCRNLLRRLIAEKKMPAMTEAEQEKMVMDGMIEDYGPCPVVPPNPMLKQHAYTPRVTDTDRVVDAIERNTWELRRIRSSGR